LTIMSGCQQVRELAHDLTVERLVAQPLPEGMAEHVARCPGCNSLLSDEALAVTIMQGMDRPLPSAQLSERIKAAARMQMQTQTLRTSRRAFSPLALAAACSALAACFAFGIFAVNHQTSATLPAATVAPVVASLPSLAVAPTPVPASDVATPDKSPASPARLTVARVDHARSISRTKTAQKPLKPTAAARQQLAQVHPNVVALAKVKALPVHVVTAPLVSYQGQRMTMPGPVKTTAPTGHTAPLKPHDVDDLPAPAGPFSGEWL
jgi:hypothetical protein